MPTALQGSQDDFSVGRPLIRPVLYEQAFEDPEAVRRVLQDNGPYAWIGVPTGSNLQRSDKPLTTWFRETWPAATAGQKGRSLVLDNPLFVQGSRESFVGFEIVRIESTRINLMTPMPAQRPHFDNPYFRGLDHSNTPYHLLIAMGRSQMFERWAINVSSAVAWLFDGDSGGFTYWPNGPDREPAHVTPPMNNRVLISDNQRMYHRVDAIGDGAFATPQFYDPRAIMVAHGRDWKILEDGAEHVLPREQIRISLLWKAVMFRDREAERVHDAHLDDLDLPTAIRILHEAALDRGIRLPIPGDVYTDMTYRRALEEAFPSEPHFTGLSEAELMGSSYVA